MARRVADLELLIVLLGVAPVLFFEAWLPRWAVIAALVAVPLLWLVRWLGYGSPVRASPLNLPVLILLLMAPVGVWAATNKSLCLPHLYRIILGAALLYAAAGTLSSARRLGLMAALLAVAVPALALFALWGTPLSVSKLPVLSNLYESTAPTFRPFWRPTGLGPNSVAGALAMLLPLPLGLALGGKHRWLRITCVLACLFAGTVLFLTQSRGAWLGFALAALAMLLVRSRWSLLVILIVAGGGVAALATLGTERLEAFMLSGAATSAVESLEGRLAIWSSAIYMVQDFPLTGIGLGMFDRMLDLVYPLTMVSMETNIYHPHNLLLFQALSSGLPGLVGLISLILLLFAMSVQSLRWSRGGPTWPLALGLLGTLIAVLGHGLFDSPTAFIRASAIMWLLYGLQAALWLHLRGQRPSVTRSDGKLHV